MPPLMPLIPPEIPPLIEPLLLPLMPAGDASFASSARGWRRLVERTTAPSRCATLISRPSCTLSTTAAGSFVGVAERPATLPGSGNRPSPTIAPAIAPTMVNTSSTPAAVASRGKRSANVKLRRRALRIERTAPSSSAWTRPQKGKKRLQLPIHFASGGHGGGAFRALAGMYFEAFHLLGRQPADDECGDVLLSPGVVRHDTLISPSQRVSPGGAAVGSPGREPWVPGNVFPEAPEGRHICFAPPGLVGV